MKLLFFISIVTGAALCNPVHADSPVTWYERCLQAPKDSVKQILHSLACQETIVTYCQFATESGSCFERLREHYSARTKSILATLPKAIESDTSRNEEMYSDGLSAFETQDTPIQCLKKYEGDACETDAILHSYSLAKLLSSLAEDSKDPK